MYDTSYDGVAGYLVENHQFHTELNEIAGAPILTDLVEGLWLRFGPSLRVVCGQFGTRNLPDLHKAILDALEAGDAEAAAEAMEQWMAGFRTNCGAGD